MLSQACRGHELQSNERSTKAKKVIISHLEEDVILQLIRSKCMPALLYGIETCPLRSSDNNSLDFVINRFFMKLFTRSSATAKSTARPSCLVGVLYDIYRQTNNRSTAKQPLVRNWP